MTICFHKANGVIRIKIEHVFGMMITTALATNIFVFSEQMLVYSGAQEII